MPKHRVVLTGAGGTIARLWIDALRERYDLVPVDVRSTDRDGREIVGVEVLDLLDRDRTRMREIFRDAYAVVHSAFVRAGSRADAEARLWAEMRNVEMAANVYQGAWEANVRRLVVASSNHAADYYEDLILDGEMDIVTPDTKTASYGFYGWAKEAYEDLGFVYAVGRELGRPLENVQLRIGAPRETDLQRCAIGDLRCTRRALGAYISQRDMVQLLVKSIEAEDIRDEHGVPFQVFYGISDNPHAFWSVANARRVIGYAPEDNSEVRFADTIAEFVRAARGGERA